MSMAWRRTWGGEDEEEEALLNKRTQSIRMYGATTTNGWICIAKKLVFTVIFHQHQVFVPVSFSTILRSLSSPWFPWQRVSSSRGQRRPTQHRINSHNKSLSLQTDWNSSLGTHLHMHERRMCFSWSPDGQVLCTRTKREWTSALIAKHALGEKGLGNYKYGKWISEVCGD